MKTVYAAVYMYTTLHTFMFNGGGVTQSKFHYQIH